MNLLIRKARKHDKAAFQQLMEQEGKSMYKIALAILKNDDDAADAMQETALACWEKIDTLRKDRYFKTWLTRILINNCNAIHRQRAKMAAEGAVAEPWAQDPAYANVEWEYFLECLDEKYRTIIILYYVEGFKTREIAEILQVNENTVRGRMATARKKLELLYTDSSDKMRKPERNKNTLFTAERGISHEQI